jgi:hypothetical protein
MTMEWTFKQLAAQVAALVFAVAGAVSANAAEIARVPWYAVGANACSSGSPCVIYFPQVPANRRLDLQYVSCGSGFDEIGSSAWAYLGIDDASLGPIVLPWNYQTTDTSAVVGVVSEIIVFSVSAGHRPQIRIYHGGTLTATRCTLTGELIFLQ